jgi:hypothetical protein
VFLKTLFSLCHHVPDSQENPGDILGNSRGIFLCWVCDSKGAIRMTLFPLMDCCDLLAIDPKTLRHWLKQAAMSLSVHPVDKRRKYLTQEQMHQLAILHDRILKTDEPRPSVSLVEPPSPEAPQEPAHQDPTSQMQRGKTAGVDDGSLRQKLSQLEAQVIVQQQHLILLTRDLLRERATRMDQRFSPRDASVQPRADPETLDRHQENLSPSLFVPQDPVRPLHPAEQRARFQVLPPLIEYSASGTYVVISSKARRNSAHPRQPGVV